VYNALSAGREVCLAVMRVVKDIGISRVTIETGSLSSKKKDRDWLDEPSICSSSPTSSIKRGGVIFKFLLSLYFVPTSIYSSSPTSSIKRWGVIFKFLLSLYFVPVSIIYVSRSYNRYSHMNWFIQV